MVIATNTFVLCDCVHYPSTKQTKYSNCTVNSSKYFEKNQEMHLHHHHQACLFNNLIRT